MYADSNIVHEPAADSPERISGLQALLKNVPPLPDCKLLWHRALEELLVGTRDGSKRLLSDRGRGLNSTAELHTRIEELEKLNTQVQAVKMSTTNAVSGILILKHDTNPFPSGNVYSRPKF